MITDLRGERRAEGHQPTTQGNSPRGATTRNHSARKKTHNCKPTKPDRDKDCRTLRGRLQAAFMW